MTSKEGGLLSPSLAVLTASICAGWLQHAVLHPLDTLKVRLQYARGGAEQLAAANAAAAEAKAAAGILWQHVASLELPPSLLRNRTTTTTPKEPSALLKNRWAPHVDFAKFPLIADVNDSMNLLRSTPKPLRSFYAGLGTSLLAVVPSAIVYMPTYEFVRSVVDQDDPGYFGGVALPSAFRAPVAGVATGMVCAVVRVPLSVMKARAQLGIYLSIWHGFAASARTVRSSGVTAMTRDLYAGFGATAALDVATAVVLFVSLDTLRNVTLASKTARHNKRNEQAGIHGSKSGDSSRDNITLSATENAAIGFFASAAATMMTEPIDVIRTRLMAQAKVTDTQPHRNSGSVPSTTTPQRQQTDKQQQRIRGNTSGGGGGGVPTRPKNYGYHGLVHGLRSVVASEGIASLYRGLLPRLLLKSIGGSIWYSTYTALKDALSSAT